jgi:predicted dehydrogenase
LNKLNIGIIGLGNQGKLHLKNCSFINELNVVGVADTSKRALKLAEMNGVKNVHLDYKDLLKNKEIDSVIISLPNFLHLEATTYAAEAGKNILLEKPLARNVSEGKEIISRVQKNGVKLMLGYPMRFIKN